MAIKSNADFAKECVLQGLYLGVNPHYLMAAAHLRSGIKEGTDGARIGPFGITKEEWAANGADAELEIDLPPDDIDAWRSQCLYAALTAYRAQNQLLPKLERFPSAIELYNEQWPSGTAASAEALQKSLDATARFIDPAIAAVLEAPANVSSALTDVKTPAAFTLPAGAKPAPEGDQLFLAKVPWIMEKLINDFGIKDFQAAGILGNIGLECDGFRLLQEVHPLNGRGGFGWAQWTASRRKGFEAYCSSQGLDPTSDAANYGFLKRELETTHRKSVDALKASNTLVQAVHVFEQTFEVAKPGLEHFDRRERWAKLALDNFTPDLPAAVALLLDPDLRYQVATTAISGATSFWVVEQFAEGGGQVLIAQRSGEDARVIDKDTLVLPVKSELIPESVPQAAAARLSAGISTAAGPAPAKFAVQVPATGADASKRILEKAQECDDTLITRTVPNTNRGHLACAYAVNEVVHRALGKPVGGGLSTVGLGKALAANHTPVEERDVRPGLIIISPTQGANVGHVGIVGASQGGPATVIYSNRSSRGVFSHKFTLATWKSYYRDRKGLPVTFYEVNPKNL